MRTTLGRGSLSLRFLATGALAPIAILAGCGSNDNLYTFDAPAAVVVADFNGSGYPGMAVAEAQIDQLNLTEKPGYIALVLQDTSTAGSFQPSLHFPTQGNPSAMAVGAFTPGSVDLAVTNVNDETVSVLLQTSPNATSFQPAINLAVGPSQASGVTLLPEDVAICDVNADGHPDIVVTYKINEELNGEPSGVGGGVNVILQNGSSPGTFLPFENIGSTPTPLNYIAPSTSCASAPCPEEFEGTAATYPNTSLGVACANLSGDSAAPPDIVMTSFSDYDTTTEAVLYDGGTVSIFFHDPANPGSFLPRVDLPVPGALHRVVIADVNGDGLPDIILADEAADPAGNGNSGAVVLLQNKPSSPGAQPTFAAPVWYETYSAIALAVGSLTGSALPDIVVASSEPEGTGSINVLLNTPGTPGTFQSAVVYSGLGNPVATAIGNLDGKIGTLQDVALADGTGAAVMFNTSSSPGTLQAEALVGG
jgi:hypothetical protein